MITQDSAPIHPKEQLERLRSQVKSLQDQIDAIYCQSMNAPAEEKVCEDFIARVLSAPTRHDIQYPITVNGLNSHEGVRLRLNDEDVGKFVGIRPCSSQATYLGIYLGDLPLGVEVSYHPETGILHVSQGFHNPAIWVPDLNRIVYGAESWWDIMTSPDDLRKITDADIQDVWYVKALKALSTPPKKD